MHDWQHATKRSLGFTLVELLVVIAVLGVLCALLLPPLAGAKEKSRAALCTANLRQWGIAFRMYADDNDDCLPRRGQGVQVLFQIGRAEDWFNALPPFLSLPSFQELVATGDNPAPGSSSVFICPTAVDSGAKYFLPYGMNMNLSPWFLPQPARFEEIARPASVVAMADAPGPYASTYPSTRRYSVMARHSGRANVLFLDGHTQSYPGPYIGVGVGDPHRTDVEWLTGTPSDEQAVAY